MSEQYLNQFEGELEIDNSEFVPLEIRFNITNHNDEESVKLSTITLRHKYSYRRNNNPDNVEERTTSNFMYSYEEDISDVNFLVAAKKEKDNSLLKTHLNFKSFKTDTVKTIDLGIYSVDEDRCSGFVLQDSTINISSNQNKDFKFTFLLKKKLLRYFKSLQFKESKTLGSDIMNLEQKILNPLLFYEEKIDIHFIQSIDLDITFFFIDHEIKTNFLIIKSWNHLK